MDYVDDIILPGEETGIRIDNNFVYAPTACVVDKITANNLGYIIQSLGLLVNI